MNSDKPRQFLSSPMTIIYKFIVPTFWIGGFSIWTIGTLFSEPKLAIMPTFALLISCLVCYFFFIPLKSVKTDGHYLFVSNYKKTIRIPIYKIENITEGLFISNHPVWVEFSTPTEFGSKIIFIPYFHLESLLFPLTHPVVVKLKNLARLRD